MRNTLILLGLALSIYSCSGLFYQKDLPYNAGRNVASEELSLNADKPIQTPEQLETRYRITPVKRLEKARIMYVDYELIRRDFPDVREMSNPEIDNWLLDNTAYMSRTQVAQENANVQIPTTNEQRMAYRPKDYGRALVFPVEDPNMSEEQKLVKEFLSEVSFQASQNDKLSLDRAHPSSCS